MGLVTDVRWTCPGCGSVELAQIGGDYEDGEITPDRVPVECGGMRWNPPCMRCGEFQLLPTSEFVPHHPQRITKEGA